MWRPTRADTPKVNPRSWRLLVAGLFVCAIAYGVIGDGPATLAVFLTACAAAAAACVTGPGRNDEPAREPWCFMGVAFVAARRGRAGQHLADGPNAGWVVPIRALSLLSLTVGLWLAIPHPPGRRRREILDPAIVAIGAGVVSWIAILEPIASRTDVDAVDRLVAFSVPVLDMVLLTVVVRLLFTSGASTAPARLLLVGAGAILAADTIDSVWALDGPLGGDASIRVLWIVGAALVAGAAFHPQMSDLGELRVDLGQSISTTRLVMLGLAAVAGPIALIVRSSLDGRFNVPVVVAGTVVLFALILMRMAGPGARAHLRGEESRRGNRSREDPAPIGAFPGGGDRSRRDLRDRGGRRRDARARPATRGGPAVRRRRGPPAAGVGTRPPRERTADAHPVGPSAPRGRPAACRRLRHRHVQRSRSREGGRRGGGRGSGSSAVPHRPARRGRRDRRAADGRARPDARRGQTPGDRDGRGPGGPRDRDGRPHREPARAGRRGAVPVAGSERVRRHRRGGARRHHPVRDAFDHPHARLRAGGSGGEQHRAPAASTRRRAGAVGARRRRARGLAAAARRRRLPARGGRRRGPAGRSERRRHRADDARRDRASRARVAPRPPGLPRHADRPREPGAVRGSARAGAGAASAQARRLGGGDLHRPRRLQDGQRHPRPPVRRRAAHHGVATPGGVPPAHGHRGAAGRRRVRRRAGDRRLRRRAGHRHRREPHPPGAAIAVHRRRPGDLHPREPRHRRDAGRRHHGRRAPAQRRHRDVRREELRARAGSSGSSPACTRRCSARWSCGASCNGRSSGASS